MGWKLVLLMIGLFFVGVMVLGSAEKPSSEAQPAATRFDRQAAAKRSQQACADLREGVAQEELKLDYMHRLIKTTPDVPLAAGRILDDRRAKLNEAREYYIANC
jgi:hypothetical protein